MNKKLRCFSLICFLLCFVCIFTCIPFNLGAFARSSEYERMMKLKNEDKKISSDFRCEYDVFINPFESFSNLLALLLYTEQGKNLTFEKVPDEGLIGFCGDTVLFYEGNNVYGQKGIMRLTSKELKAATVDSFAENSVRIKKPLLYTAVRALNIEKEELKAAYEKLKTDPRSIRSQLFMLTDEEFESVFEKTAIFGDSPSEYFFDALYLPDEEEALSLLCKFYSVMIDGKVYTIYDVFSSPMSEFEEFRNMNLATPEVKTFIEDIKKVELSVGERNRLETFASWSTEQGSPETGDNTPIFLTLTALSVLGLCALAVTGGRKKKERL